MCRSRFQTRAKLLTEGCFGSGDAQHAKHVFSSSTPFQQESMAYNPICRIQYKALIVSNHFDQVDVEALGVHGGILHFGATLVS